MYTDGDKLVFRFERFEALRAFDRGGKIGDILVLIRVSNWLVRQPRVQVAIAEILWAAWGLQLVDSFRCRVVLVACRLGLVSSIEIIMPCRLLMLVQLSRRVKCRCTR